jgi:hypothetical protein
MKWSLIRQPGRVSQACTSEADEVVLFADPVHPTHAVRPVGCWASKDTLIAVAQTSGRQPLNIHGAIFAGAAGCGRQRIGLGMTGASCAIQVT